MEATAPPPPPPSEEPPRSERPPAGNGGRAVFIVIGVVAVLAAIFFGAVAIDLAGTDTCEDARQEAIATGQLTFECTEKSSANKAATVVIGGLTALLSLALAALAFGAARRREGSPLLRAVALAAAVGAVITFIL
jgi:ABC-type Co2+ transport system permease subunit